MRRGVGLAILAAGCIVSPVGAQGYRLRLDTRYQAVSFRGLAEDSIPAGSAVVRPGQGPVTPDGFAATCPVDGPWCYFYRSGSRRQGHPVTGNVDLQLWGLGLRGVTARVAGRWSTDLGSSTEWPGTRPPTILTEGYLQYEHGPWVGRAGRQVITGRLGYQGFDGAQLGVTRAFGGLDIGVYGGWGLARAVALPVTSPALNPLDDFQPRDRQLVVGALLGVRYRWLDLGAEYRREVDPVPDHFVAERAAASLSLAPRPGWRLRGGAEFDFTNGWWGSADASASYSGSRFFASGGVRRYRPFFDLWTIWGAFSPVAHRTAWAAGGFRPVQQLWIRIRGERYQFDEGGASSPLAQAEDRGWRASIGASLALSPRWTVDGGYSRDAGPGAASSSLDGGVTFAPGDGWSLHARGGSLARPLEFRHSASELRWYSAGADVRLTNRWRFVTDLLWLAEDRRRPDAAAFDFDQLRLSSRLVLNIGSDADRLPPGIPRRRGTP